MRKEERRREGGKKRRRREVESSPIVGVELSSMSSDVKFTVIRHSC